MPLHNLIALEDSMVRNEAGNAALSDISRSVHHRILVNLIRKYIRAGFDNAESILRICFDSEAEPVELCGTFSEESIPALCEDFHISYLNSGFRAGENGIIIRKKSKERIIETGSFYTPIPIAEKIVATVASNSGTQLEQSRVLDFACGTGRFYMKILECFPRPADAVLHNAFAIDIDYDAVLITRLKAISLFNTISDDECRQVRDRIVCRNALYTPTGIKSAEDISTALFGKIAAGGFDVIVSNPPYRLLKPNRSKAGTNPANETKDLIQYFRKCGLYPHSTEGMLNLYKLSIERMMQMLRPGGELGVICPSTLFADISSTRLRKHMLSHNKLREIHFFAEKEALFDNVSQATNIFYLQKGGESESISLHSGSDNFSVDSGRIQQLFPENMEIPAISAAEWDILHKLSAFPKLKDLRQVRNRRGELDLTICKKFITDKPTAYRLVRGNMIGDGVIKNSNNEFVSENFVAGRSGSFIMHDFKRRRLVCQQISNAGQQRRLKFAFCERTDILGNSCNYLSADEDTLRKLCLLLNSSILNWRFKITSSNNHINNYELDELPIADLDTIDPGFTYSTREELDAYVGGLYGLTMSEIELTATT